METKRYDVRDISHYINIKFSRKSICRISCNQFLGTQINYIRFNLFLRMEAREYLMLIFFSKSDGVHDKMHVQEG
jgi:hypothetical protein